MPLTRPPLLQREEFSRIDTHSDADVPPVKYGPHGYPVQPDPVPPSVIALRRHAARQAEAEAEFIRQAEHSLRLQRLVAFASCALSAALVLAAAGCVYLAFWRP